MSLVQAEALVQTADVQLAVNLHVREEVRWLFKCAVLPCVQCCLPRWALLSGVWSASTPVCEIVDMLHS